MQSKKQLSKPVLKRKLQDILIITLHCSQITIKMNGKAEIFGTGGIMGYFNDHYDGQLFLSVKLMYKTV